MYFFYLFILTNIYLKNIIMIKKCISSYIIYCNSTNKALRMKIPIVSANLKLKI